MSGPVGQGNAIDEFHRQIGTRDPGIDGKDVIAHDGFVREMVQNRGFLAEQGKDGLVASEFRQNDLDGDGIAGLDIVPAINLTHAAGSDLVVDAIDAVQLGPGTDLADSSNLSLVIKRHVLNQPCPPIRARPMGQSQS